MVCNIRPRQIPRQAPRLIRAVFTQLIGTTHAQKGNPVTHLCTNNDPRVKRLDEVASAAGARVGALDFAGRSIDVMTHYYNARPTARYGGNNEIQRNILAKQVLKLSSR